MSVEDYEELPPLTESFSRSYSCHDHTPVKDFVLPPGPWDVWWKGLFQEEIVSLLSQSLCPIVGRILSFFSLARAKSSKKNTGYGFACFRTQALMFKFDELMDGLRVALKNEPIDQGSVELWHQRITDVFRPARRGPDMAHRSSRP